MRNSGIFSGVAVSDVAHALTHIRADYPNDVLLRKFNQINQNGVFGWDRYKFKMSKIDISRFYR
jgi:hypothetical protein